MWSGQYPNEQKSEIFITKNTQCGTQRAIRDIFHFKKLLPSSIHLGLPSIMPRSKVEAFKHIQHRIDGKLTGWKAKLLSQAGRSMLVKAVVSAIPTYGMSSFLLPASMQEYGRQILVGVQGGETA